MKTEKIIITAAALAAAAALAVDGTSYTVGPFSPTGGVSRVQLKPCDVQRLDYRQTGPGTLRIVKALGTNVWSTVSVSTAAGYGQKTADDVGLVGAGDYLELVSVTNTTCNVYILGK